MIASHPLVQQVIRFTLWIAAVLAIGTIGYVLIEGWDTHDGFYMSVITMATVGYSETRELSQAGRVFTCLLIFSSIVCLSCWTACLTGLFVELELSGVLGLKRAKKMAAAMTEHTIICGSGTMARTTLETLLRKQVDVVLIDSDADQLKQIRSRYPDLPIIESSAIDEMALASANILDAKYVVAALDSDFDNLMIAMTCKELGTDVQVIARSDDMQVASRMMKMGVERVICPFQLSGQHAAEFAFQ